MTSIYSLDVKEDIKRILDNGGFLRDVESHLRREFPNLQRGISRRSIRRYCQKNGLRRFSARKLDKQAKENAIKKASREVGPAYGSVTLQGYLRSKRVQVSLKTINKVLKTHNPVAHEARKNDTMDRTNPVPYFAPKFGYKGHIDQNEKLVRYGVVHAVLRDGHSGFIESWITLPSKNPIQLYTHFFRPVLIQTGIFDQLRVDMGREWILILFVQELLKHQRQNETRPAHVKSTSKKNLTIERVWPEVNARVNYPIKRILVDLEERGIIDLTDDVVCFCVSWFSCEVAKVGMQRFVASWNSHRIKGKQGNGIPSHKKLQSNTLNPLPEDIVPDEGSAVTLFEAQGGVLQREWRVGMDPLSDSRRNWILRKELFFQKHSFEDIFTAVVQGDNKLFKKGLKYFIKLTTTFGM